MMSVVQLPVNVMGDSLEVTSNYLSLITLRGVATQFFEMESFKGPYYSVKTLDCSVHPVSHKSASNF